MFCNQCGTQLPDNSRFCSKCGASFGVANTAAPAPVPAPAPAPAPRPAPVQAPRPVPVAAPRSAPAPAPVTTPSPAPAQQVHSYQPASSAVSAPVAYQQPVSHAPSQSGMIERAEMDREFHASFDPLYANLWTQEQFTNAVGEIKEFLEHHSRVYYSQKNIYSENQANLKSVRSPAYFITALISCIFCILIIIWQVNSNNLIKFIPIALAVIWLIPSSILAVTYFVQWQASKIKSNNTFNEVNVFYKEACEAERIWLNKPGNADLLNKAAMMFPGYHTDLNAIIFMYLAARDGKATNPTMAMQLWKQDLYRQQVM